MTDTDLLATVRATKGTPCYENGHAWCSLHGIITPRKWRRWWLMYRCQTCGCWFRLRCGGW